MPVLRTPDERFSQLSGFPFKPHYRETQDADLGPVRMHYLDEGPQDGAIILCLHGEPSWSYLYRKMIPLFVDAGFRVLAPDLIGFGRSDKPSERSDYTYAKHVQWLSDWLEGMGTKPVNMLAQDWGGLIGLRLATQNHARFARLSLSNTGLPTGDHSSGTAFENWRKFSQTDPEFDMGAVFQLLGCKELSVQEVEAYRAPFPDQSYKAGARQFPMLVPTTPDNPASADNRRAWKRLMQWEKPVLLCFSDNDPITAGAEKPFLKLIPGTQGQPHRTLKGRHFIQEDDGVSWAEAVIAWIEDKA